MSTRSLVFLSCGVFSLLSAGCVSSTKTTYVDEVRVTVRFESAKAETRFYEAIPRNRARIAAVGQPQETNGVNVILVAVRERKVTSGPNRDFNTAVRFCDVDLNGFISEAEADGFWSSGVQAGGTPYSPAPVPALK